MIKTNELMVGSLGYIGNNKIYRYRVEDFAEGIQMKPIPLTPEIIETCGFTYNLVNGWFKVTHHHMKNLQKLAIYNDEHDEDIRSNPKIELQDPSIVIEDYDPETNEERGIVSVQSGIKYLHQLQNVYFTLTGKQLKITGLVIV